MLRHGSEYRYDVKPVRSENRCSAAIKLRLNQRMLNTWLAEALQRSGVSQAELSRRLTERLGQSIDRAAVNKMVKGTRDISAAEMLEISKLLKHPLPRGAVEGLYVPIIGYVGAGSAVQPFDGQGEIDQGPWIAIANASTVGVRVRGESMSGRADDGDLIYYDERRNPPTPDMSGKLCVVGLADGRVLVKRLFLGRDGAYNLLSTNAEPIMDADIEWAARVTAIVPR